MSGFRIRPVAVSLVTLSIGEGALPCCPHVGGSALDSATTIDQTGPELSREMGGRLKQVTDVEAQGAASSKEKWLPGLSAMPRAAQGNPTGFGSE